MFARALFALLAQPGMVAFVVPVLLVQGQGRPLNPLGLVPLAIGVVGLLSCVRSFYVEGKGTLAPWLPPRWRSNRRTLAVYALAVMMAFHLRVVFGEEPWPAPTHGDTWARYRAEVPRWIGKGRQA